MVSGPTEQLRSVYAKLDRAEMQLYEAKGILRDYLSGEPYTVIPETDPVQGFRFYVKGISPPLLLSVVAGSCSITFDPAWIILHGNSPA